MRVGGGEPFTLEAWGLIVAGVFVAAMTMLIIDYPDMDDYPYDHDSNKVALYLWRIGKAFYIGMFSLMTGSSFCFLQR